MDYEDRRKLLALPLLQHGIASAIYLPPWYGERAPEGQPEHYIETVADYALQMAAVTLEIAQIVRWMSKGFPVRHQEHISVNLGITGISWGGAMAATSGMAARVPIACVPCAGSYSARPMATGAMVAQLDVEAETLILVFSPHPNHSPNWRLSCARRCT